VKISMPVIWFQFLLGRLETLGHVLGGDLPFEFQFLLGRLETACLSPFCPNSLRFQFLLGRLETKSM